MNPLISYQIYLNAFLTDSHFENSEGTSRTSYQRAIEPAFDIRFQHPIYMINTGYRRTERWSTASLQNDSRATTDFFYARFNLIPRQFPGLSLQFDRTDDYDHLTPHSLDTTSSRYFASSWYDVMYKDIKFAYNLSISRNENKTPTAQIISKTINDTFNGSYTLSYNKLLWNNRLHISAGYKGNYVDDRNTVYSNETGEVSRRRTPQTGLYGIGTQIEPEADVLVSVFALTDEIYNVPVNTTSGLINIGLNGTRYQNIGIHLFPTDRAVDTIYIYVNEDVTFDTNLTNPSNWRAYASDINLPGSVWTEISIQSITVSEYDDDDPLSDIYRYGIRFSTAQQYEYFKLINMNTATVLDVLVTEIEAFGTDVISESGKITDKSQFFSQAINFNATIAPVKSISLTLNFFLNRADQNPESILKSIGGAFENIFNKLPYEEDEDYRSNVTRTYGATASWRAHTLLTTTARVQRSEAFDNKDESDFRSDTFSLGFNSSPLPTLSATLSLIRTYTYSFDEKQSMSDLYLLTLTKKLYEDLDMVTDIGYSRTEKYAIVDIPEDTESSTKYIRGTIQARLTPKLSANMTYGFSRTSGETSSSTSNNGLLVMTYRPGRFINLSGRFGIEDNNGNVSTAEGILFDWRFLPDVRLNLNYEHRNEEPQSITSDLISGYIQWYITKFLQLQFTSSYQRTDAEAKNEVYNFGVNLSCRFW